MLSSTAWMLSLLVAASPDVSQRNREEAAAQVEQIRRGQGVGSALARLRFLGEERWAAARLAEALAEEGDPEMRRSLAHALAGLGVASSEPVFVGLTRDRDGAVRMSAAEGLGRLRSRHTAALLPLLADANAGVRRKSAEALGHAGQPQVGARLLAAARIEGEPEVRAEMLVAIGRARARAQVKGLEAFLEHSSESTRLAAAKSLCLLGARSGHAYAARLLASDERTLRQQGLRLYEGAPAKVSKRMVQPLLGDTDAGTAALAARILHEGGEAQMLEWLVLQSHAATGDTKLAYERELETLMLSDADRAAILRAKGLGR